MRKYYQLLLLITSVISVSLLLIYRHEYNRLRYVLEVFNFFGQPVDCTFSEILNSTSFKHDWGPVPIWTTNEDFSIYSAYLKNENDVEALIAHKEVIIPYCYLWLENNNKGVIGSIKYSKLHKLDNKLALYKYECHSDSVPEIPYAVSFSIKKSNNLMKIPLNPLPKKKYYYTTICVLPNDIYSKQEIIEFLSFHKILGFETFIIYDNNIPYKFMNKLQKISMKLGLELISYPWNYPYQSSKSEIKNIVEEDCLLRTKDKSRNVVILNWNELIVPRHHNTIGTMLDTYDPANRTDRFGLKTMNFCSENNDRKEPYILHSLHYDATTDSAEQFLYRTHNFQSKVINTQEISASVAAIHRYVSCDTLINYSKTESVMLKFSNAMRKSTLYKLFKYDRI